MLILLMKQWRCKHLSKVCNIMKALCLIVVNYPRSAVLSVELVTLTDYKQLLDEVFVISRIIEVEVGVISRSRRLIHVIVLLYIEQKKN